MTSYTTLLVECVETRQRYSRDSYGVHPGMWNWKSDPEAPWWVKLRRARLHIDEVHQRVNALDASAPWSVEKEPAEDPDSWAFRFRIHRPIPADLRTCGPLWPMR
jgi:hypothetical protein